MYTEQNFKTKKELKEAVKAFNEGTGKPVYYYQPNDMGFAPLKTDGTVYLEGPHYPKPHSWYAQAEAKDGVIVKIVK